MDGYVEQALQEFAHTPSKQHHFKLLKIDCPDYDYGAKIQYVKNDTIRPLRKKEINFLQRVVGKCL